ncbi:MAG: thiamine phosphate synthase [Magnetococcales bacterium]|nr:thiamine phosphate synthase [Magnetococcales bacterium]
MSCSNLFSAGIYPVLDAEWLQRHLREERWPVHARIRLAMDMEVAGIGVIQLRCKNGPEPCRRFIERWIPVLRGEMDRVRVIINDHPALVMEWGADGVHVGQEDVSVAECRALLGHERVIGLSTHNRSEIMDSQAMAIDYIGFGPIFSTDTKPDARPPMGLGGLAMAVAERVRPVVAIGGIQPEHLVDIAASGAAAAAMISGLWGGGGRFLIGQCMRAFALGREKGVTFGDDEGI